MKFLHVYISLPFCQTSISHSFLRFCKWISLPVYTHDLKCTPYELMVVIQHKSSRWADAVSQFVCCLSFVFWNHYSYKAETYIYIYIPDNTGTKNGKHYLGPTSNMAAKAETSQWVLKLKLVTYVYMYICSYHYRDQYLYAATVYPRL